MSSLPSTARVLHVDDEPALANMAATYVEQADDRFDVETATSASEGLKRLATTAFDCIVSDYEMPGTDGIELLKTVRETHPNIPFILYTGKGSEEVASEAISAGVTDYLQKETGTDQYTILANRIRNAVRTYHAEQTAQRVRELAEQSNDVLWMFSADWEELLFVNSAYEDIWGQSVEALAAEPRDFLNGIHPDDRDRVRDAMQQLSAGETTDLEYRVNEAKDYNRCVWVQAKPIRDADGEVTRIAGFARDVTSRRRREGMLQELHAVATELTNCESQETICQRTVAAAETILDFDTCVINLESNGLLKPVATSDNIPPDGVKSMSTDEGIVGKTYRGGESIQIGDVQSHPDAEPQDAYRAALSIPVGDAGVFQAVADEPEAFNDRDQEMVEILLAHTARALERLDYTRQLERERDRFEAIFEAIPDPIAHVKYKDKTPILQTINPAFADTFDTIVDTAVGQSVNDVVAPETRRADAQAVDAQLRRDGRIKQEVTRNVGGTEQTFLFQASGLEFGSDEMEVIGVYTDLTEQHARERELKRQNDRLDRFVSAVSHDLRNPLNVAQARLELANETCDCEHVRSAGDAVERSIDLVDNLLTLAREGEAVNEREPVALTDLVDRCWQNVRTKKTTLTLNTDRTIRADTSRLKQLVENLIGNAVEHGGSNVTVTVGELADGFYIADDGAGIPEDEREQIFDPGYSTAHEGTGFGLNIVEEIAEAHGWDIQVTDSQAGGVQFEITGVEFAE